MFCWNDIVYMFMTSVHLILGLAVKFGVWKSSGYATQNRYSSRENCRGATGVQPTGEVIVWNFDTATVGSGMSSGDDCKLVFSFLLGFYR